MFRFTIRDVLWLTVGEALGIVAWRAESGRHAAAIENAEMQKLNRDLAKRNEWKSRLIRSVSISGADTFIVPAK
jgi:hypothetical protein